jgi:pimeloyl-ACP methyl ester carboxylesterase
MGSGQRDQPGRAVYALRVASGAVSAEDDAGAARLRRDPSTTQPVCFRLGGDVSSRSTYSVVVYDERERNAKMESNKSATSVVLIHGAWAEGSCWSAVIEQLQAEGYHVTAPQFPLTSLADDVARLRQVLALQDGPTVLVGHSYGGQIMTALGADAPNVVALVYVAAFGLDQGESLGALLGQGPVTPALAHRYVDERGFVWLSEDDFVNHFAADVDPVEARVFYAVQQPLAAAAFEELMGIPAWKSLPSWYLVATDDEALAPDAERLFATRMGATVVEIPSSHLAMVSHPGDVAKLTGAALMSSRTGETS